MTSHELELVVGAGAVFLAAAATKLDVSPWRIFGLAGIATIVTVALTAHVAGEPCGAFDRTGVVDRFFEITIVSSLTLYAAAALGGIADGIRLRRADPETAISRAVGIPMVSGMGVAIVFFAFIWSIGNCLD
jgi:hypothetical protein